VLCESLPVTAQTTADCPVLAVSELWSEMEYLAAFSVARKRLEAGTYAGLLRLSSKPYVLLALDCPLCLRGTVRS
jgi:hypothetical protein